MKVPKDVICGVCKKVFCCAECRYKHEIKTHAIVVEIPKVGAENDVKTTKAETTNIYLFCPLCERKPMPLQKEMYAEMLAHVEQFHLPLRCRKCAKVYNRIDDLQNFSKCTPSITPTYCYPNQDCCNHYDHTCDTVTMQRELARVTISTQTSPQRHQQSNEFHQTPISMINLRWKAKNKLTHEEIITDSISSLKNISSINNSSARRSLDAIVKPSKGQLVRTTSTPVHAELLYTKHAERTFNATGGGQVSSIHHSAADSDQLSPAIVGVGGGGGGAGVGVGATAAATTSTAAGLSPHRQYLESVNRYLKVGGARAKMTAVTPLRHVMSKSIQKAFAEHGGLLPTTTSMTTTTRLSNVADLQPLSRKILDTPSMDANNSSSSPARSPLDLRLSPAVRRTHHEIHTSHLHQATTTTTTTTTTNAWLEQKSAVAQNLRHEVLRSSQKLTTTESIVITRTHARMTSIEPPEMPGAAGGGIRSVNSNDLSSNTSKASDRSTGTSSSSTSYNSAVSGSSGGSVYKSCQSIEIITATTALSDIQQDYYAVDSAAGAAAVGCRNATAADIRIEQVAPTMETVAQVISSNLPPITPITRIPGALINKKFIRFDSPCEEDELTTEKSILIDENREEEKKTSTSLEMTKKTQTPLKAANAGSKIRNKVTETPLSANNSTPNLKPKDNASETPPRNNTSASKDRNIKLTETPLSTKKSASKKAKVTETPLGTTTSNTSSLEAFFTPDATTPIRRSKPRVTTKTTATNNNVEKWHELNKITASTRAPLLSKIGRNTPIDRSESSTSDNDNDNDNEVDEVSHDTISKCDLNQNTTTATLGRSWSFGAILGSMMRLPSKSKGTAAEKIKTPSPQQQHSNSSLIKRCASLAGSLVRSQSLCDREEEMYHNKRKRSYATESSKFRTSNYSDPLSPTTENSLRTKRFRIHGRKPIERMRRDI